MNKNNEAEMTREVKIFSRCVLSPNGHANIELKKNLFDMNLSPFLPNMNQNELFYTTVQSRCGKR